MPLLTRRATDNLLRRIYETGGMTESMEADINRLRADFDEREGILRRYGEVSDAEDTDEYEYKEFEREDTRDYKAEYDALKQRYIDRFFEGDPAGAEKDTQLIVEEKEPEGNPEITYDDLFE